MVGWHHQLDKHEFEQAPGDGEGQGSLACCNSWDCEESDITQWLNNNKRELGFQQKKNNLSFTLWFLLEVKVDIGDIHGNMELRSAEDNEICLSKRSGIKPSSVNKSFPCFFRANKKQCIITMKEHFLFFMYQLVKY